MCGVATYYLKSEKLPTPAEMIQPRYDSEYKFLITQQQQRQPFLVQPRYKWRFFRLESSKEVEEINNMSTSKEEGSSSESKISIPKRFWTNCTNEVLYFRYSPLFVHMASGSLGAKEFNEYVANYAHLLNTFLEVYKLAADQCEDNSDKAAFLGWSYNVKLELERHNSIVEQKLGLNPTIETTLHPATEKYKEFLLATASSNVEDSDPPVQQ
ncbi:hypothetical protein MKW92_027865 [Papaver armeniacum]|nr:hypothetical protein MKW92_027865 [Papaver armeniacum]